MSADPIAVWKSISLTRASEPFPDDGARIVKAGDDLAAALDRAHATLRRIVAWYSERGMWDEGDEPLTLARERLENP